MKLIPIILISMLLAGCTVPVNFYLRNTATKVVEIRARYIGKKDQDIALKYKESLLDINYDLFKTFDKDLLPKESKNSYLTFALPPHATFFIGRGLNFDNFVFDKIIIVQGGISIDSLTWEDEDKAKFKTGANFPNRHYAWYDIEQLR